MIASNIIIKLNWVEKKKKHAINKEISRTVFCKYWVSITFSCFDEKKWDSCKVSDKNYISWIHALIHFMIFSWWKLQHLVLKFSENKG